MRKIKNLWVIVSLLIVSLLIVSLVIVSPVIVSPVFAQAALANDEWPEMSLFHMNSKWKDHQGKALKLHDLAGETTLVAMVYTSCEHTCPMIVSKLFAVKKALPKKYRNKLKLALISFDPKGDTPAALAAYKEKRNLDDNWTLMTGDQSGIRKLAAVLGVSYKKESDGVFSHSNILSVVAKDGVVVSQINELNTPTTDMVDTIVQQLRNQH